MKNLILLLKQFYSFFIFLVLEIICLAIVFKNNSYQQSSYINSTRVITGNLYKQKNKLFGFFKLKAINDSLLRENARLRQQIGIPVAKNLLPDSSYNETIKKDSFYEINHFKYIPAKVLNNSIDQKINYITLDVGRKQGIKENFPVISPQGIVGKISHVSDNYSLAVSFLSEKFKVGCRLPDSTLGFLIWDGKDADFATLTGVPQSIKLKPLDSIYTNGFSMFPENILVGRAVERYANGQYKVYLASRFRKLNFVYVIAEETNIERIQLEKDSTQAP